LEEGEEVMQEREYRFTGERWYYRIPGSGLFGPFVCLKDAAWDCFHRLNDRYGPLDPGDYDELCDPD
jgi:hypothetical protein